MKRWPLVASVVLALAAPAAASDFWDHVEDAAELTEPAELDALIENGAELGVAARNFERRAIVALRNNSTRDHRQNRALMKQAGDSAVTLLERALELDPDNATLHYAIGVYLYEFVYDYYERDLPMATERDKIGRAAIEHWSRFEELSPKDPRRVGFARDLIQFGPGLIRQNLVQYESPYQFKRSIIYTKLGDEDSYTKAVEDYDYCLAVASAESVPHDWRAQLLTNSAEILMALGRLEEAIERYEESFNYSSDVLYMYGLAVAYDRKGLTERAMDLMRDATARDSLGKLGSLDRDGVFFIPPGEVHYYRALGNEANGDATAALLYYRQFLSTVEDSRYLERADWHIRQLEKRGTKKRK